MVISEAGPLIDNSFAAEMNLTRTLDSFQYCDLGKFLSLVTKEWKYKSQQSELPEIFSVPHCLFHRRNLIL